MSGLGKRIGSNPDTAPQADSTRSIGQQRGVHVIGSAMRSSPQGEGTAIMKLTTTTQVSVDGVVKGNGGPDENRSGGFERGGWARPLFDSEAMTFVDQVYQRADAFLFGRRTYELFAGY